MLVEPINIFYEEPNPDRWFKYDRYPRAIIRRIIRGKQKPGGVMMIALNLVKGLELLKIPYRFNDYKYAKQNPNELIGVIGKPQLVFEKKFKNPILFGAGVYSHPIECPNLFEKYSNVKKILVPGPWMQNMFEPFYGNKVDFWPIGIDKSVWNSNIKSQSLTTDFLIYNKINHKIDQKYNYIVKDIILELKKLNKTYTIINYGFYNHQTLLQQLSQSKAVIFLSKNETQGLAYQQILATGTPILAWDREGYWEDPYYYPKKVKYKPVSSVPYWDSRCGIKFKNTADFKQKLSLFLDTMENNKFDPESFILEYLILEVTTKKYIDIYNELKKKVNA